MRRALLVGVGSFVALLAIGAGILVPETAPSSISRLEAKLATSASTLPGDWSVYHAPTSMNELSVPAGYRCFIPPSTVFGDVIANEQFRSRQERENLSETIGIATTGDPTDALHLWRSPWLRAGRCLQHFLLPRTVIESIDAKIQPFETGVIGWTGYAPLQEPLQAPAVAPGAVLFRYAIPLIPYEAWVSYGVLRDGYVVEIAATGRMAPVQVSSLVDRVTAML